VGPRAGLDKCGKSLLAPRFNPRTNQPVVSRYTDYATRPKTNSRSFNYNNIVRHQLLHVSSLSVPSSENPQLYKMQELLFYFITVIFQNKVMCILWLM
jgi:hypothetical protein